MSLTKSQKRSNFLEEYKYLQDAITRRNTGTMTINSILLPSSIIIIGLAIEFRMNINSAFPIGINASGFLPLFSILILTLSAIYTYASNRVNKICYERIKEIERELGLQADTYVYLQIKDKWWWKLRELIWWIVLPFTFFICAISSYFLFL